MEKTEAPCSESKVAKIRGKGHLLLIVMLYRPRDSVHGCRVLSFFSTKKNPAPNGEDEGRIMPATNKLQIYISPWPRALAWRDYITGLTVRVPKNME